jgi:8-oxo-dGTP diphosphatase
MRARSVAVVIERGELLVIARRKNGREHCVLPGGGIEAEETAGEACVRELQEETGLHGQVATEPTPPVLAESAVYFRVTAPHQAPLLGGPEAARSSECNSYMPRWVPTAELDHINLVPDHARDAVRRHLGRPS